LRHRALTQLAQVAAASDAKARGGRWPLRSCGRGPLDHDINQRALALILRQRHGLELSTEDVARALPVEGLSEFYSQSIDSPTRKFGGALHRLTASAYVQPPAASAVLMERAWSLS